MMEGEMQSVYFSADQSKATADFPGALVRIGGWKEVLGRAIGALLCSF